MLVDFEIPIAIPIWIVRILFWVGWARPCCLWQSNNIEFQNTGNEDSASKQINKQISDSGMLFHDGWTKLNRTLLHAHTQFKQTKISQKQKKNWTDIIKSDCKVCEILYL